MSVREPKQTVNILDGRLIVIGLTVEEQDNPRAIYEVVARTLGMCSCQVKRKWPQLVKTKDGNYWLEVGHLKIAPDDVEYFVRAKEV